MAGQEVCGDIVRLEAGLEILSLGASSIQEWIQEHIKPDSPKDVATLYRMAANAAARARLYALEVIIPVLAQSGRELDMEFLLSRAVAGGDSEVVAWVLGLPKRYSNFVLSPGSYSNIFWECVASCKYQLATDMLNLQMPVSRGMVDSIDMLSQRWDAESQKLKQLLTEKLGMLSVSNYKTLIETNRM